MRFFFFIHISYRICGIIKSAGIIKIVKKAVVTGRTLRERYFMNRFTGGLIAGGLLGAAGVAWAMSDGRTRRRMVRNGRHAVRKANTMFENVHDLF